MNIVGEFPHSEHRTEGWRGGGLQEARKGGDGRKHE